MMNTILTSLKKIKPRYIGLWFKDQLSRPDWFRNMVVDRSAWGAFSIYAHARRSDGTLSSARQYYAWRPLVDAGLRQIIDLRADYKSDAYHKRCEEFGISYYHYPVVRGGKLENEMADHFPELCAFIDKGHFYIACAHGLHTHKIMRALNEMYEYMTHRDGKEPMPIEVFRKRKNVIKELSKA